MLGFCRLRLGSVEKLGISNRPSCRWRAAGWLVSAIGGELHYLRVHVSRGRGGIDCGATRDAEGYPDALRRRRFVSSVAITKRLLASTAAPTHNSKRSFPSARQRFMPRPRHSTEMRPSMPARKRCPSLKGALLSYASRAGAFLPPRCGMHTTLTPLRVHDERLCSLKKPRSAPYNCGARPNAFLWRSREVATWISSEGFPFSTSYCVIRPCALSARNTLWPNSMGVRTLPRLIRSV